MAEDHEGTEPNANGELTLEQAMSLGIRLQQAGHPNEAARIYRAVLDAYPDHADALHFLGLTRFAVKDAAGAVELIERALAVAPSYADAWINLGNIRLHQQRYAEGERSYRQALALQPANVLAWNNLGLTLKGLGRWREAIEALTQAVSQAPDSPEFSQNLGKACCAVGDFAKGASAFRAALDLRPYEAAAYQNLCRTLYILKEEREAELVVRRWLEHDPENPTARHLLAAYSKEGIPARASDAYILETFDGFAEIFDEVLATLDYRAPQLVADALAACNGEADPPRRILDAGCGTGLCGPLLRPYADNLIGADLSEKMLERAARRGVYDELVQAELTAFLCEQPDRFDAIVSADTLVYFGALHDIARAAYGALTPGGLFVFTLERAADTSPAEYWIGTHGRYSHVPAYARDVLTRAGFAVLSMDAQVLRHESGEPVEGLVTVAARPESVAEATPDTNRERRNGVAPGTETYAPPPRSSARPDSGWARRSVSAGRWRPG